MAIRIHPTALIEDGVKFGDGTSVWDHAHIRHGAELGEECIVGGKSLIAYDVRIGSRVKINSAAYICNGVTLEGRRQMTSRLSVLPRRMSTRSQRWCGKGPRSARERSSVAG
jgi:UDP-3-O-[3-hydroxymyristoyl] glucosamine N-acyltransferase